MKCISRDLREEREWSEASSALVAPFSPVSLAIRERHASKSDNGTILLNRKRGDSMSEQKTISAFFGQDHDRLDELLKAFQQLKRLDFAKAKEAFKEFKFGLQRHIVWEEDLLFPIWEEKTGMAEGGPT
ncbi:MAG: hypothetical protein RL042_422, partial [Nitrospirota bacterium]